MEVRSEGRKRYERAGNGQISLIIRHTFRYPGSFFALFASVLVMNEESGCPSLVVSVLYGTKFRSGPSFT
jgi:hypothetical protein